jgi:hypothetical protein
MPLRDLSPVNLALAVLAASGVEMAPKAALTEARKVWPDVVSGSFYNVGTRLERDGLIRKTDSGWAIVDASKAPVINVGYAWGPVAIFSRWEVASHRRELILHLLGDRGGQMIMQIVAALAKDGCKAPVTKDLVKVDMQCLQKDEKVKRVGNSKKWVLVR